jgi:large subunit ribosomal protein L17
MRHRKRTAKLGRTSEHRQALLANLVCSLIKERRITTTLAKAKAARSVAEKMVTLGKHGSLHHRRLAVARLHQEDACRLLFKEIAPFFKDRKGGYTRIIRVHQRIGDAAQLAILEWIDLPAPTVTDTAPANKADKRASGEPEADTPKADAPKAAESAAPEKPAS